MTTIATPTSELKGDRAVAGAPNALADRRELAMTAVERTRMPMVITDPRQPDNPIVLANRAYLDLSGYAADEVIGRNCRMLQGEGTSQKAISEVRAGVAEEREMIVELLNYRKDGTAFWNQLSVSPIHDDKGALIYFFGSQMDVTKRRQAQELEAAELRLLREVDHRAMNALALVQGIVRLSQSDNPQRYAAAIQGRVSALARAHTMLADRAWSSVSLSRLLEGELQPHGLHRATLDGADIAIAAQLVQPLALAFHEMAFNAAVHGSLSDPAGSIRIVWQEDPGDGTIRLSWREVGGPPPADVRPPGFGSSMIKSIVVRQLRGKLEMDWRPEGLAINISVPKERNADTDVFG